MISSLRFFILTRFCNLKPWTSIILFFCRYGGQAANFTADDLTQSPGEQDFDLQDLMRKLSTTDKPPDKEESQKSDQATAKEDGDNTGKFKVFRILINY